MVIDSSGSATLRRKACRRPNGGQVEDVDVFDAYVEGAGRGLSGTREAEGRLGSGQRRVGRCRSSAGKLAAGAGNDVINGDIDGTFPSHHPDPTVAANSGTGCKGISGKDRTTSEIALDGDGDRIGVVDDRGRIIWADLLMALLVRRRPVGEARRHSDCRRGSPVKFSSTRLRAWAVIPSCGGRVIPFIKAKMIEANAPMAGEMSGPSVLCG